MKPILSRRTEQCPAGKQADRTHQEARTAIREHHLTSIPDAMSFLEWGTPNGCATCRPALNYYLLSTFAPCIAHDVPDDEEVAGEAELTNESQLVRDLCVVLACALLRVGRAPAFMRALFNEHGAEILGVSTDNVRSHKKFQAKYHLTFPLLADTDHAVADQYGVWQQRKFMGREYMGIARTTFVVDKNGTIKAVFPNVKVEGHADKVLQALQS